MGEQSKSDIAEIHPYKEETTNHPIEEESSE